MLYCNFYILCCVQRWYWLRESRLNSSKWLRESILNCWKWMWESSDPHDREEWVESEFVGENDESSLICWEWVNDLGLNSWKWMSAEGHPVERDWTTDVARQPDTSRSQGDGKENIKMKEKSRGLNPAHGKNTCWIVLYLKRYVISNQRPGMG